MSDHKIETHKKPIKDIFELWFKIPEYQRPYRWTEEQITELLEDIEYSSNNSLDNEYFLGALVLQKKELEKSKVKFVEYDLLDGQQRLTTLLLLMAVLRDLSDNKQIKKNCQKRIFQEEDEFENIPERLRIEFSIRKDVEDFIKKFIVNDNSIKGNIEKIKKQIKDNKNDISIKNISNAILVIYNYFLKPDNDNIERIGKFFQYLLNNVVLIIVSTENFEDAYRLFTILNDRGLPLRNSDILKSWNLGELNSVEDKKRYGEFWESMESYFEDEVDRFLSYIRTILVKEKARTTLLKEFEEKIYNVKKLEKGINTLEIIKRYKKHYEKIINLFEFKINDNYEYNNLITVMKIGFESTDWIPPLLLYYDKFEDSKLLDFTKKLDKKFSTDWVNQLSPTARIENMNKILKEIDNTDNPDNLFKKDVFSFDVDSFLDFIDKNDIYNKRYTKYIMLKLNYLYQDNSVGFSTFDKVSVEHILPQNPDNKSQWVKDFSDDDRNQYTHKLGNLILIGRIKNASLGRKDYSEKRKKYFEKNIGTYPHSLHVYNRNPNKWALKELKDNHKELIKKLKEYYS